MTRTFVDTGPKCLKPKLTRLVETHEWRRCSQCCDVPACGDSSIGPSTSVQTIFAVAGSPQGRRDDAGVICWRRHLQRVQSRCDRWLQETSPFSTVVHLAKEALRKVLIHFHTRHREQRPALSLRLSHNRCHWLLRLAVRAMDESSILERGKANRGLTQRSGSEDVHDVHHKERSGRFHSWQSHVGLA
jgi:hypothetical protein